MKFDCGPTYEEVIEARSKWHPFFAIWPRRVGPHDCRCFEWIERKGTFHSNWADEYWVWEYRAMEAA